MNSVKCPQCGLVNFGVAGACKRCGLSLDVAMDSPAVEAAYSAGGEAPTEGRCSFCGHATSAPFCPICRARVAPDAPEASYRPRSSGGGSSGLRLLRRALVLAVLVGVGLGVYAYRYRIWYGKDTSYLLLIRDSGQFGKPLNVTVSKNPQRAAMPGGVNVASIYAEGSALVLESRGLVTFGVTTSQETRQMPQVAMPPTFSVNPDGSVKVTAVPTSVSVTEQVSHVGVALTPEGQKEAANWTESDASQWRVPIGKREIVSVDKVGAVRSESGAEKLDVEFSWRWLPNALGEAFDDGEAGLLVPHDRVRMAVNAIGWNSSKAYRAVAHLERQAGGEWSVVGIEKSANYIKETELSAF